MKKLIRLKTDIRYNCCYVVGKSLIFGKKMLKNMDIPGDVGDVPVGSEVWADNHTQTFVEPDLGI